MVIPLRLSYSQIKLFKQCPRKWYYRYVQKKEDVPNKYLHFGSAVHEAIEHAMQGGVFTWQDALEKYPLANTFSGQDFKNARENALQNYSIESIDKIEHKIFVQITPDITFVGYIDAITKDKRLVDWKTGSFNTSKANEYGHQLQYYMYLYKRKYGKLPKGAELFFVKQGVRWELSTIANVDHIEAEILQVANDMRAVITKNDAMRNQQKCFAYGSRCPYFDVCHQPNATMRVAIDIKGNTCFLSGDTPDRMINGIYQELSYELQNAYWMRQTYQKKYGGLPAPDRIGWKRLFNKKYKAFALGHLNRVKKLIRQYAEYAKVEYQITINDGRQPISRLGTMPDGLNGVQLRPYQEEAVEAFFSAGGVGYLEMATGSGKTITTAEIIRRLDVKTLWLIDRKELLEQTREVFEKTLQCTCTLASGSEKDFSGDIVLSTIQTLGRNTEQYRDVLSDFSCVVVDEAHHASCETYQRVFAYLNNTYYRLGTTGTVKRDDGNEMILESLVGEVVYRVGARDLIDQGYLQQPKVIFHRMKQRGYAEEYASAYREYIVRNVERNNKVVDIAKQYDRVMIIVKHLAHLQDFAEHNDITGLRYGVLHGSMSKKERKQTLDKFRSGDIRVLIGTTQIVSEGLDIPELDCVINASGNKGEVKTIQSLGRVLRKAAGKTVCEYHDFIDDCPYLDDASKSRVRTMKEQGYEVEER